MPTANKITKRSADADRSARFSWKAGDLEIVNEKQGQQKKTHPQHGRAESNVSDIGNMPVSGTFFQTLGGSRLSENYLSRMFQACFTASPAFRQSLLRLLWKKCHLAGSVPDALAWTCVYQPAFTDGVLVRPDLCLHPPRSTRRISQLKPIYLESKVNARLTESQLANYLQSGADILVAITKNWPEISRRRIFEIGANHVRWQDIARALAEVKKRDAKDKFLCAEFANFLEYNHMTYRADITETHLEQIRKLLTNIGTTKFLYFVPKGSFGLAESCISLLADARRIAEEELPDLAKCKNWGPGYYHETNSAKIERHVFGMEMWPGIRGQSRLICGIEFSAEEGRPIRWLVAHYGSQAKNSSEKRRAIKNFFDGKVLDPARLARAIVEAANEWKFL